MSGAFGSLYGVKIPDNPADEMDENDLPYLEMLYKFVYGKHSYYDLAITRHVEPQAKTERLTEEEGPTDRQDMSEAEQLGSSDCTRSGSTARRARTVERTAPQYKRKKQHWQVSPYTRVRVKQRIKRWDGFLCVIHM